MLTKLQNQPSLNSNKHKFRKRMVPISNSFVGKAHSLRAPAVPFGLEKALTGVFGNSGRACLGLLALFLANFAFCNTTFAESVSISVSSTSETFALAPGSSSVFGKSNDITASITTDYPYGYEFTVAGPNDEQKLKSTNSHLLSISSVATENDFKTGASTTYDNKWGFLPSKLNSTSNTEYQPSPKKTTPTPIDVTLSANPDTANNYTFAIAARVDNTVPKETYSGDFTLAAVANYAYFGIGFADASSGMPAVIHGLTNNGNVTFTAPAAPTKTGYTFKGWCSVETGDNGSCDGTTYNAGTEYTISLSSNFIDTYTTLYATWQRKATCLGYYSMQDIANWKRELSVGDIVTACDSRDYQLYRVGKLVDNNIWMLDNLALETTANDLSSDDTNVPSTWQGFKQTDGVTYSKKLPASSKTGYSDNTEGYTTAKLNSEHKDEYSTSTADTYGQADWKFGVYYNFCAASAGTYCMNRNSGSGNAQYDICPKGWRLPSGGTSDDSDFGKLYLALGGTGAYSNDEIFYAKFRNTLKLPFSGTWVESYRYNYSCFWSNTFSMVTDMRVLNVSHSTISINPSWGYGSRFSGSTVRCMAQY